jgi:hemolysin activation/secretion protein
MATKKAPQKLTPIAQSPAAAAVAPALAPKKAAPRKKAVAAVEVAPKKAAPKNPKKKAAVAAPAVEEVVSLNQLQDEIRTEAYSYYIARGYRAGDPTADWHHAEDVVLRRHGLR